MQPSLVTWVLIAVNVAVSILGFNQSSGPRRDDFVFIPSRVAKGKGLLGLLLSHFSHADVGHLLLNMMSLYFFAPIVETSLGPEGLLMIYVLSGIAASLAIFVLRSKDLRFRVLGASGAVSGIVFAAIVLRPAMNLSLMFVPIPVPAPLFAVIYVAASSYFMGRQGSRICHEAHVGGAVAGLVLAGMMSARGFDPLLRRIQDLVS